MNVIFMYVYYTILGRVRRIINIIAIYIDYSLICFNKIYFNTTHQIFKGGQVFTVHWPKDLKMVDDN